jgi:hypothetical protein
LPRRGDTHTRRTLRGKRQENTKCLWSRYGTTLYFLWKLVEKFRWRPDVPGDLHLGASGSAQRASQLLLDLFGDEVGEHARVAIGVAGLPWNVPLEIQADLELEP